MPEIDVIIFADEHGAPPLLEWMDGLPQRALEKCMVKIERLQAMGHELRRPEADYLRDGIHELRAALNGIQYRILYFFQGKQAVISHGLIKIDQVPPKQINLALERKAQFERNPEKHTYGETLL